MNDDTDKKFSDLSDEDVLELTRMTEADKWASGGWRALASTILPASLFLIPAAIHIGHYMGADEWLSWPENLRLAKYAAMALYVALAILMFRLFGTVSRGMLERLDEVERHIEYRAVATAGQEAIWMGVLLWGFSLWFPDFYRGMTAILPLLTLLYFYIAYYGIRIKLRQELNA